MSRSNQLAGLITATPTSTLDTINEINTSLNNDANLSTTLTNSINAKASKSGDTFTGNVGVGVAPASNDGWGKIVEVGGTAGAELSLNHSDASATQGIGQVSFTRDSATLASVNGVTGSTTGKGELNFRTHNGTSNATRMTVDEDGNVGIGTDPSSILHLDEGSGTSGFLFDSGHRRLKVVGSNSGSGFVSLEVTDQDGSNASSRNLILESGGGNVGIGFTTPTHTLDAYSTKTASFSFDRNTASNASNLGEFNTFYALSIKNRNSGSYLRFGGDASNAQIQSTDGANSPTGKNIIFNPFGGFVGIGDTPDQDFQVGDAGKYIGLNIKGKFDPPLDSSNNATIGGVRMRGGRMQSSINNHCTALKIYDGGMGSNRTVGNFSCGIGFMHLDSNNWSTGNTTNYIGMQAWIGLKLVDTPGQERSSLVIATTNGYAAGSMPREVCSFHPTTGAMHKNFIGSFAEGAKFGPSMESGYTNNFSVAIASDDYLIRFANASYAVLGSIRRDGSGILWSSNSDHRLKENVTPLGNALERLNKLSPKRFTWKEHPEKGEQDGFIAHEVDEVVPQAVDGAKNRMRDNGDIWPQGLDMSKLVPLLTASIQELSAKVTALENAS